jgi:hypothetical protein
MIHSKTTDAFIARVRAGRFRSIFCCLLVLMAAVKVCKAQDQGLRAGGTRVDITPPLATGALAPTGRYEHEHLYVRAIVIDNGSSRAALLGADQAGLSESIWKEASQRIAKDLNCSVADILMSATHTHSPGVQLGPPPATQAAGNLSPNEQRVVDAMVNAAHQAKDNLSRHGWLSEQALHT